MRGQGRPQHYDRPERVAHGVEWPAAAPTSIFLPHLAVRDICEGHGKELLPIALATRQLGRSC
jgi:hypothetical protein